MNIHEYQAKELFVQFGVPSPRGLVAATAEEAERNARQLPGPEYMVKAQIHAGGRGKGTFKNGFQGGVHLVRSPEEVRSVAAQMLGQTLVTKQTGPEGRLVRKVLIAEATAIQRELYLALLLDRAHAGPVLIASTEGGMDIEEVAEATPERILREPVHPTLGLQDYQCRKIAKQLGTDPKQTARLLKALYRLFIERDCNLIEINPLIIDPKGQLLALDAKFGFDENALFRQPDIAALRDKDEEDPRDVAASEFHLNYIGLDGDIACMVNGAGLAMATMDIIQHFGGRPANFLDVGGGANEQQVTEAFKLLVSDPNVKAILVNIFGGIMKCDVIAQGIISAARNLDLQVPLVVRLEGTNVEQGKQLLASSDLAIIPADNLADAARKVVDAAQGVPAAS